MVALESRPSFCISKEWMKQITAVETWHVQAFSDGGSDSTMGRWVNIKQNQRPMF